MAFDLEEIMGIHTWRNALYHQGQKVVIQIPEIGDLVKARQIVSWVMSTLFQVGIEEYLPVITGPFEGVKVAEGISEDSDWNRLLSFRRQFIELLKSIGVDENQAQQLSFDNIIDLLENEEIGI